MAEFSVRFVTSGAGAIDMPIRTIEEMTDTTCKHCHQTELKWRVISRKSVYSWDEDFAKLQFRMECKVCKKQAVWGELTYKTWFERIGKVRLTWLLNQEVLP